MDLRQLRSFLLIADTGSLSGAAERLHTVQPALSRQIRLLEADLGIQLFQRHARGMTLTDAGELLRQRAKSAFWELEQARADMAALAGPIIGRVGLGMLPSVTDLLVGRFAKRMRQLYERVNLQIVTGLAGQLLDWLERQEIDVAVVYEPAQPSNLEFQALVEESLFLVGPRSGAIKRRSVKVASLGRYPLILPTGEFGLRDIVNRAARAAGIELDVVMEANFMHVQKSLIEAGIGYSILPSSALHGIRAEQDLTVARIIEPALFRRIGLAMPITRRRPLAARRVAELIVEEIGHSFASGGWPGARLVAARSGAEFSQSRS